MKKIIYLFSVVSVLMTASCSDFLDRYPDDQLSPGTFWKTQSDALVALTGCYSGLNYNYNADIRVYQYCWEATSDNALMNFTRYGFQEIANGSISATSQYYNKMSGIYDFTTIHACNDYLKSAASIQFPESEQWKAEVRCIRAYDYLVKVFNFGDIQLFTENAGSVDESKISRTPKEQVYQFIEKELEESASVLPIDNLSGRFTRGAAYALLARTYLYEGKYQDAYDAAKKVTGYSLPLNMSYEEAFQVGNQNNSDLILGTEYDGSSKRFNFTLFMPNSISGWSAVIPTQQLVDAYEMADGRTIEEAEAEGDYDSSNPYMNRDPRLRATIFYTGQHVITANKDYIYNAAVNGSADWKNGGYGSNQTPTGYNVKKYFSGQGSANYQDQYMVLPLLRYAEVLLTIAESCVELNKNLDEAYDALDQIRVRAGMPKVDRTKYDTAGKLRELVRRERRVELAFEGLRRYDIIRWGIANDVLNCTLTRCPSGEILDKAFPDASGDMQVNLTTSGAQIEIRNFVVGKNELLPFPQSDLDINPNLKQNPQY